MDLSSSGHSPRGKKSSGGSEAVTLLSYANSRTGTRTYNLQSNTTNTRLFSQNAQTTSGGAIPPIVAKKSEKFFKTFRRRSKSASRVNKEKGGPRSRSPDFRGSDYSLNQVTFEDDPNVITYTLNGERARNPDFSRKPDQVTLVGFASHGELRSAPSADNLLDYCNNYNQGSASTPRKRNGRLGGRKSAHFDFGGSVSNLLLMSGGSNGAGGGQEASNSPSPSQKANFATLKTSREVKMERERLRQERLSKLTQETRDWFEKTSGSSAASTPREVRLSSSSAASIFAEERAKFFDEARDRFHSPNNELFTQFVRENHERFAQLVHTHRAASTLLGEQLGAPLPQQQQQLGNNSCYSGASTPVSAFSNSSLSKASSSSSSLGSSCQSRLRSRQQQQQPVSKPPRVHHIKIQRENLNCEVNQESGQLEVSSESSAKIEIIVNEGKDHEESNDSHSDVGSSCSDGEIQQLKAPSSQARLSSHHDSGSSSLSGSPKPPDDIIASANNNNNNDVTKSSSPAVKEVDPNSDITEAKGGIASKAKEEEDLEQEDDIETRSENNQSKSANKTAAASGAGERLAQSGRATSASVSALPAAVGRSLSGASRLSSSSSGFSSIGQQQQQTGLLQEHSTPNAALTKLQQLQERRSAFHHPSFANHFGFGRTGTGLRAKTSMDEGDLSSIFGGGAGSSRRESTSEFPAFPNFGNFPSFTTPLLLQASSPAVSSSASTLMTSSSNTPSSSTPLNKGGSSNNNNNNARVKMVNVTHSTGTVPRNSSGQGNNNNNINGGMKMAVTKSKSSSLEFAKSAGGSSAAGGARSNGQYR